MPHLSAHAVVIHYEEALYQVYAPLPVLCNVQVFEANAGYKREFTLTNTDGEVFEEELSWGVESQIHVQPQHVATATLMVDERRQTGSFVVETRMRGTVYVSFTSPRDNNAQVIYILRLFGPARAPGLKE